MGMIPFQVFYIVVRIYATKTEHVF